MVYHQSRPMAKKNCETQNKILKGAKTFLDVLVSLAKKKKKKHQLEKKCVRIHSLIEKKCKDMGEIKGVHF